MLYGRCAFNSEKKAKEKGINFVIARGATAPIIKNNSDIHVIDLYQNSVEILRAITKIHKIWK